MTSACSFTDFLDFLCPEFVKSKILPPEVSLQNSDFCRGFQNSEFSGFLEFFEFLKAKKVTPFEGNHGSTTENIQPLSIRDLLYGTDWIGFLPNS